MTLEIKQYRSYFFHNSTEPYRLSGVIDITDKTEYGEGHFAITISDRRVFYPEYFEYVKDADSGKYYIKDGIWVADNEE